MSKKTNLQMEIEIVEFMLNDLIPKGYTFTVVDEEGEVYVKNTADIEAIKNDLFWIKDGVIQSFTCSIMYIRVLKDGKRLGSVMMIGGNGYDNPSDVSGDLEAMDEILKPTTYFAEKLCNDYHGFH